jgi:hypothetical protein
MRFPNSTCHLSSLELQEGEKVLLIPIFYSNITELNLYNQSNDSCSIAWTPMNATYIGGGSVKLSEEANLVCDAFRESINKNLVNIDSVREHKSKQRVNFTNFYLFNKNKEDEIESSLDCSDSKIILKSKNTTHYYKTDGITTNSELLNYLQYSYLTSVCSDSVSRFGYQIIKKDIYDSIVNKIYLEKQKRISSNLNNLLDLEWNEDLYFEIGQDKLAADTLELYNINKYLVNKMLYIVQDLIKAQKSNLDCHDAFFSSIIDWSLLITLYSETGKTFYPNARKQSNMMPVHTLNSVINTHIDEKRAINRNFWSVKNGYCSDQADKEEWNETEE